MDLKLLEIKNKHKEHFNPLNLDIMFNELNNYIDKLNEKHIKDTADLVKKCSDQSLEIDELTDTIDDLSDKAKTENENSDTVLLIETIINDYDREIRLSSGFDIQLSGQKVIDDLTWLVNKLEN